MTYKPNFPPGRVWPALASVVALVGLLSGCRRESPPASSEWAVMGTFAAVHVPAGQASDLAAFSEIARRIMEDVNSRMTVYDVGSELSRVNASAGVRPEAVSDMTREALALSRSYAEITGGAFDPTVGPIVRLWGFGGAEQPAVAPSRERIDALLRIVGHDLMDLDGTRAFLSTPGANLDLGGIAKGYAVDLAFDSLMRRRPTGLMVNLGGNIRCAGEGRPGRPWQVGVRDPFEPDQLLGTLALTEGMAVATSGNYEKFVVIEGTRYAHIIDPRTGTPVTGMAGVTVLSDRAVEADALSTAFFVLGMRDSLPILARLPHCGALFVPDVRPVEVHLTSVFAERFTPSSRVTGRVRLLVPNQP